MTFEQFMDKKGYGFNDFDRCYEMEELIKEYAKEIARKAVEASQNPKILNTREGFNFDEWFKTIEL